MRENTLMSMEGKFIVIEGIDRSGKTTLLENVMKKLEKKYPFYQFKSIHYPDRETETGKIIDKYLRKEIKLEKHASHLLFSANRWEKDAEVRELVKDNIVISSRYYFSGISYSVAGLGIERNWAIQPDFGLLEPDLIIFLDVLAISTAGREDFGTEVYDNAKIQENIYFQLKKDCTSFRNCKVVDGLCDIDTLAEKVLKIIETLFD